MTLDALTRAKLTGEEAFSGTDRIADDAPVGHPLDMTVLDFWQWSSDDRSSADLLSNTMRGIVAEYIVAKALAYRPTARRVARLLPDSGIRIPESVPPLSMGVLRRPIREAAKRDVDFLKGA